MEAGLNGLQRCDVSSADPRTRVLEQTPLSDLVGTLRVVPVSNPLAMEADARCAPLDVLDLNRVFLYQANGAVKDTGGSPPVWLAPTEGPFAELALWSESSTAYTVSGGANARLLGVFFTPEAAPFKLSGNGDWGQQDAQFISFQLVVVGGGLLQMIPGANLIPIPATKGTLIR